MAKTVFNRIEKKYIIPSSKVHALVDALKDHMQVDEYKKHTICNIYYDTEDSLLIRRSIEKPAYKEKLRLRSYGVPTMDSTVFLEIKKKYNKVVNKRRVQMTLREACDYLERGIRPANDNQILKELDFLIARYEPKPMLYLAYDRVALFDPTDSEFRITFDSGIRSRRDDVRLEAGDHGLPLMPPGYLLMESKMAGAAPLWFSHMLADLRIYPASFSKYGNIYKKENLAWSFNKRAYLAPELSTDTVTEGVVLC